MALVSDGEILSRVAETGHRTTGAFQLIEQALKAAGRQREDVECLAIGLGPGSYTGIRVAISIGTGWRVARGVRLRGVSTVDCLAMQAKDRGVRGLLHLVIDAHRNEYYHAGFALSDAGMQSSTPLHITTREEILRLAANKVVWCSPDLVHQFPGSEGVFPNAGTLGQLAANIKSDASDTPLEPIYLRETSFVKAAPPRPILLE